VQHGQALGPVDVAAFLRLGTTGGIDKTVEQDAQTRNDQFFGSNASLAPGPLNTGHDAIDATLNLGYGKWRLRAGYLLRDKVGTGAGVASALDPVGSGRWDRITADLSYTEPQFTRDWALGFVASHLRHTQRIPALMLFPPGVTFPTGTFPDGMFGMPETWERHWRLSAFATYTGFAAHRLRLGIGHDNLDMYRTAEHKNFTFTSSGIPMPTPGAEILDFTGPASFLMPHRRKVDYLYAQDEWQLAGDWSLTTGLRHDRYSDVGGTTNPRAALVWNAAYNVTAKLLYGRAFRAPAFTELYSINNPVARGNENLRPETIDTAEAVVSWQARRDTEVKASLFRYRMKNILRAVPNSIPGTGATFQNTGDQTGHGVELEAVWDATRNLRLSGNYAYQRSIDQSTRKDAGYAPRHQLHARGDWRFLRHWLASAQLNGVAGRRRAAGDDRPPVADYATLDLSLRTDLGRDRVNFAASVRNLFNVDVREPSLAPGLIPNDLPQAGRAIYLQATLGF